MGTDKALLTIDNRPLAIHAAKLLEAFTQRVTLVGDPATYGTLELPVVSDRRADCGPLAGIESVLATSETDWNLIVACDVPGLTAEILRALLGLADDGAEAIVPQHGNGRLEPLCAMYHRNALAKIQAALDAGTRRVTDALTLLTLRYLAVAEEGPFRNLNTPEDFDRYRHG